MNCFKIRLIRGLVIPAAKGNVWPGPMMRNVWHIPYYNRGTMKRIFIVLACILALSAHAAADLLSPQTFTEEFKAAASAALPDYSIAVVEPLQVNAKKPGSEEATAYLDNAYNEYSRAPENKDSVIARYVANFVEITKGPGPVNPEWIVPVIKDRGWLKSAGGSIAKSRQVIEELNRDLIIVYAEDTPEKIRYFSATDLEKAGVPRDKVRELAIANLRRILPPVDTARGPLISMLTAGQDYVASLLLLEDIWTGGKLEVEGEVVVAIPTRGVLLFTGSKNKDGVKKLRELAKQAAAEGPYTLTDRLFVYRDGKFERF